MLCFQIGLPLYYLGWFDTTLRLFGHYLLPLRVSYYQPAMMRVLHTQTLSHSIGANIFFFFWHQCHALISSHVTPLLLMRTDIVMNLFGHGFLAFMLVRLGGDEGYVQYSSGHITWLWCCLLMTRFVFVSGLFPLPLASSCCCCRFFFMPLDVDRFYHLIWPLKLAFGFGNNEVLHHYP